MPSRTILGVPSISILSRDPNLSQKPPESQGNTAVGFFEKNDAWKESTGIEQNMNARPVHFRRRPETHQTAVQNPPRATDSSHCSVEILSPPHLVGAGGVLPTLVLRAPPKKVATDADEIRCSLGMKEASK